MHRRVLFSIIAQSSLVFVLVGSVPAYSGTCCTKADCGESPFCQEPDQASHAGFALIHSDAAFGSRAADSFTLTAQKQIDRVRWWGAYLVAGSPIPCGAILDDDFTLTIHTDAGGQPGAIVSSNLLGSSATRIQTGKQISIFGNVYDEYQFTADLVQPFVANAGDTFWVVVERGSVDTCAWYWETAPQGILGDGSALWDQSGGGYLLEDFDLAFCINPVDVCHIPAVSVWGVTVSSLLVLAAGIVISFRGRLAAYRVSESSAVPFAARIF